MAAASDVNDDGYGDVIVGAPYYDNGNTDEGKAFLWHGSSTGLGSPGTPANADWTAESDENSALLGYSVASAGDVNGDGYGDIIIGARDCSNGQNAEGRVFVWHGGSSGLGNNGTPANADWKAESNQASARFGVSVACAGDVKGNGYSAVIVGADRYDNGQTDEGASFVWYGSSNGLNNGSDGNPGNAPWSKEGNGNYVYFGASVASAGDVNGDGYSDVIIGAPGYDTGQNPVNVGAFYVWHGSSGGLDSSAARTVVGDQAEGQYGVSVAAAGDVNGDGYSDVIVGGHLYDVDYAEEGIADVYLGSSSGIPATYAWRVSGGQTGAELGCSVSAAGDVNGDGYGDVIIGAHKYNVNHYGAAFVYYGNLGDGIDCRPRQWRTDLSTPVVAPLRTHSTSQVGLGLTGRTFYGRGDVKAQFEVKALGTAFNGSSLNETASWTDTGTGGAGITTTIGSLSNSTFYKWRGRIKYRLSDGAVQPFSRWFFIPANDLTESDFQVKD